MTFPTAPRFGATVTAIALLVAPIRAVEAQQAAANTRCVAALKAFGATPEDGDACEELAAYVVDAMTARASRTAALQVSPRKLQSARAGGTAATGVPGQSEAVPGAQPAPLASASVAAAGTNHGTKALTAISLNPVTLFGGGAEDAARWSRVGDLTILVPLQNDSNANPLSRFSYFGLRSRINITGLSAGSRLLTDVNAAFQTALDSQTDLVGRLGEAFRGLGTAAAVEACARAVPETVWGEAPGVCDGKVTIGLKEADYRRLQEALVRAREEADSKYFGLDLRFDAGDPTLAADRTKEVIGLQAGLAFGRRSLGANTSATTMGVSGRLGVRYSELRAFRDSIAWSFDGALGFETSRLVSPDLPARFNAGLEFRYANKNARVAEQHQTDYLALRGGLSIPMTMGTAITVAFTVPMVGDLSPSLSVNFNWAMLFSTLTRQPTP